MHNIITYDVYINFRIDSKNFHNLVQALKEYLRAIRN